MQQIKPQSLSFRKDLSRVSRYTTVAYVMATVVLCCAIIFSYFTLNRNLTEQSRLLAFSDSASKLRLSIRDSSLYLSDLKQARESKTPGSLIEEKITFHLDASISTIHALKRETSDDLLELEKYDYYKYFNEIFTTQPGDIWRKLDHYVARLEEISAQGKGADSGTDQLWLPVEATAAKSGSLGKNYETAFERLTEIKTDRSRSLESTHSKLALLSIFLVVLEILLIFLPLRYFLNKVNSNLLKAHHKLDYRANHDAETGLLNLSGMAKSLGVTKKSESDGSLIVVSITNLEHIAQTTGPAALEIFFRQFSEKVDQAFPGDKTVFRAGDNRFGIAYVSSTALINSKVSEQLHNQLVEKQHVHNVIVHPVIKIGSYEGTINADDIESKVLNALVASQNYDSIDAVVPVYESSMRRDIDRENSLIEEIKQGLDNKEFVPFYQIKVQGETGMASGMEALCRWVKPDGKIVPPFEFIPIAEKSGLIAEMTWLLLGQMATDYKKWCAAGLEPGRIAFNAAEMLLREPDYPQRMAKILEKTGTSQCPFDLEITENVAFTSQSDFITDNIQYSRNVGMSIALDDFGTGYASLSSIVELDVDTIKIDKSFVSMMGSNQVSRNIVLSLIHLCHQLNKKCVVEGVETEEEWDICRNAGCDEIQGFLFYRPAPFQEVLESLESEQLPRKAG